MKTVQFTDTSTGSPDTHLWKEGETTLSTQQNPLLFLEEVVHEITLTVGKTGRTPSTITKTVDLTPDWPKEWTLITPTPEGITFSFIKCHDDILYAGGSDGAIYSLDPYAVTPEWTISTTAPETATAITDILFIGEDLYAIDNSGHFMKNGVIELTLVGTYTTACYLAYNGDDHIVITAYDDAAGAGAYCRVMRYTISTTTLNFGFGFGLEGQYFVNIVYVPQESLFFIQDNWGDIRSYNSVDHAYNAASTEGLELSNGILLDNNYHFVKGDTGTTAALYKLNVSGNDWTKTLISNVPEQGKYKALDLMVGEQFVMSSTKTCRINSDGGGGIYMLLPLESSEIVSLAHDSNDVLYGLDENSSLFFFDPSAE